VAKYWLVLVLMVLSVGFGAAAEEACTLSSGWEVPSQGAVQMFRQGDRAFGIGANSGGALQGRVVEKLLPAPGCSPISNSKCSQNVETCSGSCTAYLHYYCKTCDCKGFKFCG
jgi:hypothetical protein